MNNDERKEKAGIFYTAVMSDANLNAEFNANPTSVLIDYGVITASEADSKEVQDYYKSLADSLPEASTDGALKINFGCWACKIAMGAVVSAAAAAAIVLTAGAAAAALASALGISTAAAGVAVSAAGGSVTALIGLLLTEVCGDC